jgi:phage tail-like protein
MFYVLLMTLRDDPYGSYNFVVDLGDGADGVVAGFSDVSGLGTEITYAEYRNGNERSNHVRKIPTLSSAGDVTLKRGVIGDPRLFDWLKSVRDGSPQPRTVTISLLDEAREIVASWRLTNAQPKKWVGPTLAAKGGGEVAMEELHLTVERVDFES